MEFNPHNPIVKLCLQGLNMQEQNNKDEAKRLFDQAWNDSRDDFEKFISAYFLARHQDSVDKRIVWFQTALDLVLRIADARVTGVLTTLYSNLASCYEDLNEKELAAEYHALAFETKDKLIDNGPFYHGTKADLQIGDALSPGRKSNYQQEIIMNHVYFTALMNGAGLAAALSEGDGAQHVFIVEPTGSFESDPNVTDKKFPGNLTRSYRSKEPLIIIGEVKDWQKQSEQQIHEWREKLARNKGEIIN